jgi:hypothetical protein
MPIYPLDGGPIQERRDQQWSKGLSQASDCWQSCFSERTRLARFDRFDKESACA